MINNNHPKKDGDKICNEHMLVVVSGPTSIQLEIERPSKKLPPDHSEFLKSWEYIIIKETKADPSRSMLTYYLCFKKKEKH